MCVPVPEVELPSLGLSEVTVELCLLVVIVGPETKTTMFGVRPGADYVRYHDFQVFCLVADERAASLERRMLIGQITHLH